MRGAPNTYTTGTPAGGLIPAHAGSTDQIVDFSEVIEAHPRACGEHHPESKPPNQTLGSSPRMRGAL